MTACRFDRDKGDYLTPDGDLCRQCEAEGCDRPAYNRGRACSMHASRMQRHGSYDAGRPTLEQRIWERVTKTATCWLWTGYTSDGYGRVKVGEKHLKVHKVVWEMARGPVPAGMLLDHICRVRNCCNPDHLEPVPGRVNTLRGIGPSAINARKTHCIKGHPLSGSNLMLRGNGQRVCKQCRREKKDRGAA